MAGKYSIRRARLTLALALALSCVAQFAFGAGPAAATKGPPFGLYVANSVGSGLRSIFPGVVTDSVASPDGSRIAFAGSSSAAGALNATSVFLIRPDGTGLTAVATLPEPGILDGAPAWSRDGAKLAYFSGDLPPQTLNVLNLDGTGLRQIPLGVDDQHATPSWSPTGSSLVFMQRRSTRHTDDRDFIATVNADGSGVRTLTRIRASGDSELSAPVWSPDGSWIAFTDARRRHRPISVYLIRPDGTELHLLDRNCLSGPAWSPDGQRLACFGFARSSKKGRERPRRPAGSLNAVSVAGGGTAVLARDLGDNFGSAPPSWSPDGSKLAFFKGGKVHVIDATGANHRRFAPFSFGFSAGPAWAAAGTVLTFARGDLRKLSD